jgi:AraC family transcriptional regulator of adaptative response/methylated-DNA-[protein]-cysteine methyltransferase
MFSKDIQKIEDIAFLRDLNKAIGIPKMEISIHKCLFSHALIGIDNDRVKAIELGKDADECYRNFINRWGGASQNVKEGKDINLINKVLKVIETGIHDPSIMVSLYGSGTYLQSLVWEVISTIESGNTLSYKDIAIKIGHPKSFRAVGTACGSNPIAIIIPCHRVVKTDGGDGGYRWGLEIKRKLLQREASTNNKI